MIWHVEINDTARKQIKSLDRQAQAVVVKFLRERVAGSSNPRLTGKALKGDLGELWRYRGASPPAYALLRVLRAKKPCFSSRIGPFQKSLIPQVPHLIPLFHSGSTGGTENPATCSRGGTKQSWSSRQYLKELAAYAAYASR